MRVLTTFLGKNPQKSIIIRVFRPFVRIMIDFCGFFQGKSSEFAWIPEIPYTMHLLQRSPKLKGGSRHKVGDKKGFHHLTPKFLELGYFLLVRPFARPFFGHFRVLPRRSPPAISPAIFDYFQFGAARGTPTEARRWNFLDFIGIVQQAFSPKVPKNLLRLFLRNNLARLKITSEAKNNLKRLFLTLFWRVFFEYF